MQCIKMLTLELNWHKNAMLIHYIMPCDVLGKHLYIIIVNKDLEKNE